MNYSRLIFLLFVLFMLLGVVSPFAYNLVNIKLVLEIIFLLTVSFFARPIKKKVISYFVISILYLSYSFFYSFNYILSDYIMVYKSFIYLIMLSLIMKNKFFDYSFVKYVFYFFISALLIKYIYSLFFGLAHRPGLLTENNFELLFLILIFIAKKIFESNKFYLLDYVLLITVILLSGSRSAMLCVLPLIFFQNIGRNFLIKSAKFIGLFFVVLLLLIVIYFRMDDGQNIEDIDRVRFLFVFFSEIENWNYWNYLFGNPPMTPLSDSSCSVLSSYSKLFSDIKNNLCYSVVLHSHILRLILDHGILGLIFIYSFLYKILKLSMLDNKIIYTIIFVLLFNSLSVSSINSIFAMFGLLIIVTLKRDINRKEIVKS